MYSFFDVNQIDDYDKFYFTFEFKYQMWVWIIDIERRKNRLLKFCLCAHY